VDRPAGGDVQQGVCGVLAYDEVEITTYSSMKRQVIRIPRVTPKAGAMSGYDGGTGDGTAVSMKAIQCA
jgi:hypothetical protein